MCTFAHTAPAVRLNSSTKPEISSPAQVWRNPRVQSALPIRRALGNRAVRRMLQRKCACGGGMSDGCEKCRKVEHLGLQAKFQIGEAGDVYEREADRVADRVMSASPRAAVTGLAPRIQRVAGPSAGLSAPAAPAAPTSVEHALAGPGIPLEQPLRQDMEQRFGSDFSRVRVHSGAVAEQSALEVNAKAYTVGHDIVFAAGQFVPGTHEGRRLLAHELTHVVQQSRATGLGVVVQLKSEFSGLPPIVLGVLGGMDSQGEMILGTYLYGGGERHDVEDPLWTDYMMEHPSLRLQIMARLIPIVRDIADRQQRGRVPIVEQFHVELPENSGLSGYALLHGSNKSVGDFQLLGFAEVGDAINPKEGDWDIELNLRFVFNDIVDPNSNYWTDTVKNALANIVTLGQPESYQLSIHWSSRCLAEVRGKSVVFYGYPSEYRLGVRPLPQGKLDWVRAEEERAQKLEADIVELLRRDIPAGDTAALAERKRKLLWSFYRLSGYWGATYVDRIANRASDDILPRLLEERISRRLRAELLDALRGRRPSGTEPL